MPFEVLFVWIYARLAYFVWIHASLHFLCKYVPTDLLLWSQLSSVFSCLLKFHMYQARYAYFVWIHASLQFPWMSEGFRHNISWICCTIIPLAWDHPYITSAHFRTFSDPPNISINSTERQQKLPFFWPHPPSLFASKLIQIFLPDMCAVTGPHLLLVALCGS